MRIVIHLAEADASPDTIKMRVHGALRSALPDGTWGFTCVYADADEPNGDRILGPSTDGWAGLEPFVHAVWGAGYEWGMRDALQAPAQWASPTQGGE